MDPTLIFVIAALILSIVIHEVAHGYAANWLGDPTARLAGRLTLNPVSHIDLLGSIIIPGLLVLSGANILFGWAKPVPYNPYNLSNQKWGEAIVAAAGPGVNILLALIFSLIIRFAVPLGLNASFIQIASYIVFINILLAMFNMIPIPPLDGSKVVAAFLPFGLRMQYQNLGRLIERYGLIFMFLFLFIFINILWVPFSLLVFSIFNFFTGGLGGL